MTPAAYSLQEAAARVGCSAERLRKAWRSWGANWSFPAPFRRPPLANYSWDAASLDAWVEGRARALGEAARIPRFTANDEGPPRPAPGSPAARRLAAERAQLARLMENAS